MRRRLLLSAVVACGVLSSAALAVADTFAVYPVDSNGSTTERHTFGFDETPFIYIRLPRPGVNITAAFWQDPATNIFLTSDGISSATEYWHSLDNGVDSGNNPVTWHDVRKQGTWNVGAGYLYASDFSVDSKATSFTVTPEPASAALFIFGGLTLAAAARRKKRAPTLS